MSAFSVYDGTTWRTALAVSVWDGTVWRSAKAVSVWDGAAWRQGFTASLGTLDAPTISAAWNFTTHQMDVFITKGANNPSTGMTWTVDATGSGTGGTTTSTTFHDGVGAEDGTQSCYTCVGSHAGWTNSDPSAEACDFRGNPQ